LRDFTCFAALTGMRKNELASLTWKMVEGGELHIPGDICKNRQARVLPLAGELAQIIERRRQAARIEVNGVTQLAEHIFHRGGRKVGCFKKAWRTACAKAKVPCRVFHDLRRTAVRRMVRAGINPQIAKKWSGHVSDEIFQRYSILTTDDMREAFEQTEKFRETEAAKVVSIAAQG
jgi:integrase